MKTFIDCIDAVKGVYCVLVTNAWSSHFMIALVDIAFKFLGSTGGTGFSAIKITALGRPEILVRIICSSLHPTIKAALISELPRRLASTKKYRILTFLDKKYRILR